VLSEAARAAFEDGPWSTMKPGERSPLIHRIADAMKRKAEIPAVGTPR
jgi:acyl-CoA reductase-like NAD-dependent aldehyde dehydrogenase